MAKETELPPPPVYQQLEQQEPQASGNSASPPKYTVATPIPLPTYDQSEKYEKDGVLQVSSSSSEQETSEPVRRWTSGSGTCFEFIVFFIGKVQSEKWLLVEFITFCFSMCCVQFGWLCLLLLPGYYHSCSVRGHSWFRHSIHL